MTFDLKAAYYEYVAEKIDIIIIAYKNAFNVTIYH